MKRKLAAPRTYATVTMTSTKRDPKTGEPFRWTLLVGTDVAGAIADYWRGEGVSVEVTRSESSGASGK